MNSEVHTCSSFAYTTRRLSIYRLKSNMNNSTTINYDIIYYTLKHFKNPIELKLLINYTQRN